MAFAPYLGAKLSFNFFFSPAYLPTTRLFPVHSMVEVVCIELTDQPKTARKQDANENKGHKTLTLKFKFSSKMESVIYKNQLQLLVGEHCSDFGKREK